MLRLCTSCPQDSGNRPSTKRERRRGISAARHTAPAEGVPSLATALVKCRNGVAQPACGSSPAVMLRTANGIIRWEYAFVHRAGFSD